MSDGPSGDAVDHSEGDAHRLPLDQDAFFEMACVSPIEPQAEVFNTYGDTLGNAQLLTQYGFILDGNDNDNLSWDIDEIRYFLETMTPSTAPDSIVSLWREILKSRPIAFESLNESHLVYHNPADRAPNLCINGDGRVSHQLWLLLFLHGHAQIKAEALDCGAEGSSDVHASDIVIRQVGEAVSLQLDLERQHDLLDEDDDDGDDHGGDGRDRNVYSPEMTRAPVPTTATPFTDPEWIGRVGQSLTRLCVLRREGSGKEGTLDNNLGDILDVSGRPCA